MPAREATKAEMRSLEVGTQRSSGVCLMSQNVWKMSKPEPYVSFVESLQAKLMTEYIRCTSSWERTWDVACMVIGCQRVRWSLAVQ